MTSGKIEGNRSKREKRGGLPALRKVRKPWEEGWGLPPLVGGVFFEKKEERR